MQTRRRIIRIREGMPNKPKKSLSTGGRQWKRGETNLPLSGVQKIWGHNWDGPFLGYHPSNLCSLRPHSMTYCGAHISIWTSWIHNYILIKMYNCIADVQLAYGTNSLWLPQDWFHMPLCLFAVLGQDRSTRQRFHYPPH